MTNANVKTNEQTITVTREMKVTDFLAEVLRVKRVYDETGKETLAVIELNTKGYKKDGNWVNPTAIFDKFLLQVAEQMGVPVREIRKSPTIK